MSDRIEAEIKRAVCEASGEPRPEVRERALAGVRELRPRRHSWVWMPLLAGVLLLICAAGVTAGLNLWLGPVEGTLHVRSSDAFTPPEPQSDRFIFSSFFRDEFELVVSSGIFHAYADHFDVSPVSDEVVFHIAAWPPSEADVWRSDLEGRNQVALTAGLGGVNCAPAWSPDGSMIAFQHAEPAEGELPCEAGFRVWVMNADGTDARPVVPEGYPPTWQEDWSPDGTRLLVMMDATGAFIISLDGSEMARVHNVGPDAAWSPDGSQIASSGWGYGQLGGVPGVWRRLVLTNIDGSNPQVLIEQFLPDHEIEALFPDDEHREHRLHDCRHWAGPVDPVWSPSGDKIAFLAAMPFDPRRVKGRDYRAQVEVWMYDLSEGEERQITDDQVAQYSLSWKP